MSKTITSGLGALVLVALASAEPGVAAAASFTPEDVAKHATKADCWMIIEGKVYDVTGYIDDHPTPPHVMTDRCGKDATEGWRTKGKAGKPHSKKAAALLKSLLKGELAPAGN
jgi:cytochrome b involved in lipid metabolism